MRNGSIWTFSQVSVSRTRPDHAEAARLEAERFQLIRRISDDLAHELKNPLNAMVINLEVLRTRVRAGAVAAALERIEVLEQETRRLHGLLDHVLRFVRPGHAEETAFPLAEVVDDVSTIVHVLAKLRRGGFQVDPVSEGLFVHTHREPLRFALLALCEAAIAPADPGDNGVRLRAESDSGRVSLLLAAPGSAAPRLPGALDFAGRALAGEAVTIETDLGTNGCTVRLVLPRA